MIELTGDVLFDIVRGNMDGYSMLYKFGQNPACDTDAQVQVWSKNEDYPYPTSGTVMYVSGSNAGDATEITVYGLDSDYAQVTGYATMSGQSPVKIQDSDSQDIAFYRVFRAFNSGSTDLSSDVYLSDSDATLTGGIPGAGETYLMIDYYAQQTLHALYTVPKDHVFYITNSQAAITAETQNAISSTPHGCTIEFRTRAPGKVFRVQDTTTLITLGNNQISRNYGFLSGIPEGTDIDIFIRSATATMGIHAEFEGVLRDLTKT